MSKETMYDTIISKEALATKLPPEFIKAIIKKESMFNKKCKLANNYGLMQITLVAAREGGYNGTIAQLYAPGINILYGSKYLASQVKLWENAPTKEDRLSLGAASYNLGRGTITTASELASKRGLHPLKWSSVANVLPSMIKPKGLSRRRVNITLNYVEMVNAYIQEFMPLHKETTDMAESSWKQG